MKASRVPFLTVAEVLLEGHPRQRRERRPYGEHTPRVLIHVIHHREPLWEGDGGEDDGAEEAEAGEGLDGSLWGF